LAGNIAIVLLGRICLPACIGRFIISKVETKPFTGIGCEQLLGRCRIAGIFGFGLMKELRVITPRNGGNFKLVL
jgi:hypothetical protein